MEQQQQQDTFDPDTAEISHLVDTLTPRQLAATILLLRDEINGAEAQRDRNVQALANSFDFFLHRDVMNAAVHLSATRWSPITINVALALEDHGYESDGVVDVLNTVRSDNDDKVLA